MTELEEDDADEPALGECTLPAGLRQDWPAPRVGAYGRRNGWRAHLEAWLALGAMGVLKRVGPGPRRAFVTLCAALASRMARERNAYSRVYIRQALGGTPAETERRLRQAWRHFLSVAIDSMSYSRSIDPRRLGEHFAIELCPEAQAVIAERRGALVISAHVGDWEASLVALPWIGLDPTYVITKPPLNRPLSIALQREREGRGIRVLPRRGAMKHAPAIVRAGGTIAMLLDQRARKRPVIAPFFGRPARCDRSAAVLVKRLKAPILFFHCLRDPGELRFRLVCDRVLRPEECARTSVEELVQVVNAELERMILRTPEQYLWLHDRYRGAPAAEAAPGPAA